MIFALSLLLILLPGLLMFATSSESFRFFAEILYTDTSSINFNTSYFPITESPSNAYYLWKNDLILGNLCNLFNLNFNQYISLLLTFSSLGYFLLVPRLNKEKNFTPLPSAITIIILQFSIITIFGINLSVLSFSAYFPFVFLLFLELINPKNSLNSFISVILMALFIYSSNQLGIILGLFFLTLSLLNNPANCNKHLGVFCFIFFLFPLMIVFNFPNPQFPNYPDNAHLVPFYGVVDGLQANIGPQPKFFAIDRETTRSIYVLATFLCIIPILSLEYLIRRRKIFLQPNSYSKLTLVQVFLISFLILDSKIFSAYLSQFMPLSSLCRMIPSLIYLNISQYLLLVVLSIIFIKLLFINNKYSIYISCVLYLAFILTSFITNNFPLISDKNFHKLLSIEDKKLISSPSLYVLRKEGSEILESTRQKPEYHSLANYQFDLFSSHNKEDLKDIFDGRESTRWASKLGKQEGNEWILIKFKNSETIRGIRINSGKFYADFPRGLEISYKEDCSESFFNFESFNKVFETKNNQGEIEISNDGFPYYKEQYNFSRSFNKPINGKCILIRQISQNNSFDWSVAEIEIY